MTPCPKTATTSVMNSVQGWVWKNFLVSVIHMLILDDFVNIFSCSHCLFYSFLQYILMTGWVNRFANAGDVTRERVENAALRVSFYVSLIKR